MLPIGSDQQKKAESIQGNTVDFMSIAFLDLAKAAAKPVARIIYKDGDPQGTGFMISPSLFITNNHVIPSADACKQFLIQFNYQENYRKLLQPTSEFQLDPATFFLTAKEDDLDFTIIALGDRVAGSLTKPQLGFLPLFESTDRHIKGMYVNCIQHPQGGAKQVVIRENRILARTDNTLIYGSDTEPGSSGSPIFNDDWEVIGLHHWGEPYRALTDNLSDLPSSGNEAIRISSIVKYLKQQQENLDDHMQLHISEAMGYRFQMPSDIVEVTRQDFLNTNGDSEVYLSDYLTKENTIPKVSGALLSSGKMEMKDGKFGFTFPLSISISIDQALSSKYIPNNGGEARPLFMASEKIVLDKNYKSRKGYDPNFLGTAVPLPTLSDQQKAIAATNQFDTESIEFKYQHFSVLMNGERKLAFYTAVNIDGASVVKIKRGTDVITRGPEARPFAGQESREKWYDDNRISSKLVCDDRLYTSFDEMKVFQRGHLVKRTDPSWGTEEVAMKAQADTFHFLNCAPQHALFNPVTTKWAGVENWITSTSDDDNIKISVFSGPVFTDNDPVGGYIKIPMAFWKVVAWLENGQLLATAIIADQSKLLRESGFVIPEIPDGAENLRRLPANLPAEYHCSIKHIENLTGLGFSNLAAFDTYFTSGEERIEAPMQINLESYEQLRGSYYSLRKSAHSERVAVGFKG